MNHVTKCVLENIKPSRKEMDLFREITTSFIARINTKLSGAKAILGGSGAKDTWISKNHDIDIFVKYNYVQYKHQSSQLSVILEKSLKKAFPTVTLYRMHGSRDYFRILYKTYVFEIVPILKIAKAEDAVNITDISPLHAIWVNKNTKVLKDDIRLAKQFTKANKLYGAESYIGGFSGYVLEILVVYYGSFEKLVHASLQWKSKVIIDHSKYYKGKSALFHLNKSKTQSPLLVIDPVDKSRNAAAALSEKSVKKFKELSRKYIRKPTLTFFEQKEIIVADLVKEAKTKKYFVVCITFLPQGEKTDVAGSKVVKVFNFCTKQLTPFSIKKSGWDWNTKSPALIYFFVSTNTRETHEVRMGPPLKMKDAVQNFKKKNKKTFIEKGKIKTKVKVKHPHLHDFVKNMIHEKYITEKVKNIQVI
ncbi:CCA tRNA nucleotidyltransferase [Candidatus Woesearchaeota archaeon CG10_big_fil_rev_8_21_14_0_10_36_11]|nr:MAG: CCA tRNA nucleotidyltransferase [Candidatus Woesearchaeota archaeon CG10_big_fil_rev_8_21_14_0_10_36_11]